MESNHARTNRKVYVADIKASSRRFYMIDYYTIFILIDGSAAIFDKGKDDETRYVSNTNYTNKRNDEIREFLEAYAVNVNEFSLQTIRDARLGVAEYILSSDQTKRGCFNPPAQCI